MPGLGDEWAGPEVPGLVAPAAGQDSHPLRPTERATLPQHMADRSRHNDTRSAAQEPGKARWYRRRGWVLTLSLLLPPLGLTSLWRGRAFGRRSRVAITAGALVVWSAVALWAVSGGPRSAARLASLPGMSPASSSATPMSHPALAPVTPSPTPTQIPTATPSRAPATTAPAPTAPPPPPAPPSGQTVFYDEFKGAGLDTAAWVAMNRPGDASNHETGCYRPSNVATGAGLALTSKADASCSFGYTSAMVQWRSYNFLYGTVDVRAKMAGGTGTWPAIWLLGADCQASNVTTPDNVGSCHWPQPGSDEIDIAEILSSDHSHVNQQIHTSSGAPGCGATVSDVSQNWHTYTFVWSKGKAVWQIDGTTTCTITQSVPSTPMFLIINTAMGGDGGGTIDASTLPQTLTVNYVRVRT
jgi:beta-glucanase (GH16 family)